MAVIFDFEGTLVDFQWQLAPAEAELRRAFATLGFSGEEFVRGSYATMWNTAAGALAPQGRLAELRRALCPVYDRWDRDALVRWSLRPGAQEVLRQLAATGIGAGLVTNIGRAAIGEALRRFDLGPWLSPIVTRDDVTFMKPDPEGIARVLGQWSVARDEVLFVGDSRADVLGARAAGIRVAILRGGESDATALAATPPDHFVSRLDEVPALAGAR